MSYRLPKSVPGCQAKAKVSLILGTSLLGKARAGDNGAIGMLARNHWGWDRPGVTTMALSDWRSRSMRSTAWPVPFEHQIDALDQTALWSPVRRHERLPPACAASFR